jgi:hypothetical protein
MPRDGSGVYSLPAGTTTQSPNTTIESGDWNTAFADLVDDANAARPITAGGTGGVTAGAARTNLDVQPISRRTAKASASGPFTAVAADRNQFWDVTGSAALTINLTAAATLTSGWALWIRNSSTATVTIDPNGAETIDGATTIAIADGQQALIICDGTGFFTVFVTGQIAGRQTIASAGTTDLATLQASYVQVTGTTTITALGTLPAGRVIVLEFAGALTFTHNATSLILPNGINITTKAGDVATMVSEGSGNWRCVSYQTDGSLVTPWVAYTPTFTGFGTAASISFFSKRVGDTLYIKGKFTAGTPTATEARITLGYNGTNANVNSDATKVASIRLAGPVVQDAVSAAAFYALIESNIGYLTFSIQSAGRNGLAKVNGDVIVGVGGTISIMAEVPISGW